MANPAQARDVLVVDADPLTRVAVAEALEDCDPAHLVDYAQDARKIALLLRRKRYSWVLVDVSASASELADLANTIREVAPETRSLLMTNADLPYMRQTAQESGFDAWLGKPFTMHAVRNALLCRPGVKDKAALRWKPDPLPAANPGRVTGRSPAPRAMSPSAAGDHTPSTPPAAVHDSLRKLLDETRARAVLLITSDGYAVDAAGATQGLHLPTLGALISANFAAAAELSRLLGNPSDFRASHHQGSHCHIYTYMVPQDLLLAVIFGEESRVGAVWLFAKRAGEDITTEMLTNPESPALGADLAPEVNARLAELFEPDKPAITSSQLSGR